ncbi:MAG TPA: hemerythrin domain-containing protein [Ignavibacteria bacterium]
MNITPNSLKTLFAQRDPNSEYIDNLTLGELCNYIVKRHHAYVRENIPLLRKNLEKICEVHGEQHPELFEIKELFISFARDFTMHMQEEEIMLFPFIHGLESAKKENSPLPRSPFHSISNPIVMMIEEHQNEDQRFNKISELSKNYLIPEDTCTTYEVTLNQLKDFENDLHLHIQLENNILFPKAFELIKE